MDGSGQDGAREQSSYGVALLRRAWIVVLAVVLGVLAAAAATMSQQKTYTSTAVVLVQPIDTGTAGVSKADQPNLDTEAQIVKSAAVGQLAESALKVTVPVGQLTRQVTVTVPPNSDVLRVSASASTRKTAQARAQAFANAYLQYRKNASQAAISGQLTQLEKQRTALEGQLQVIAGRVSKLPANSADRAVASAQQSVLVNDIESVQSQIVTLTAATPAGGALLQAAPKPGKASSPSVVLNGGAGVAAGLLIGLVIATLLARRDDRVWSGRDVERQLELPVLAEVRARGRNRRVALARTGGQPAAAFGALRNAVVASRGGAASHVVLVTPVTTSVGGGAVAANLAASLARTGVPVILVSTAARSVVPALLDVPGAPGLGDALLEHRAPGDLVHASPAVPALAVLPTGTGDDVADLLASPQMTAAVAELRTRYAYTVIEAPPADRGAEAQALAAFCDTVILVAETRRTTRGAIAETCRQLGQVRARILGVVVTGRLRPLAAAPQPAARRQRADDVEPAASVGSVRAGG